MREEALCVRQIVKKYLKDNGYDGLWCDDCACVTDDIAPCGHIGEDCEAGYKRLVPPDESCGCCGQGCEHWHIEPKEDAGGDAVTTREQALAVLGIVSPPDERGGDQRITVNGRIVGPPIPGEDFANAILCWIGEQPGLRAYLAQPEGGDVEEALEAVAALDDIVVEAIYDLVDDGQSGKGPQDYLRDWATIRSALRSAKEREAAAVERTVEKAKAAMRELAHPGPGMGTHRPAVSPYALDSILAALDSLKETP